MSENDDVEEKAASSEEESQAGDIAAASTEEDIEKGNWSAVSARRKERAQPLQRQQGDREEASRGQPANRNKKHEVGNIGLMVGTSGERSETQTKQSIVSQTGKRTIV